MFLMFRKKNDRFMPDAYRMVEPIISKQRGNQLPAEILLTA